MHQQSRLGMQHLLDVPYLNMGLFVMGEDDVRRQRELTKPIIFYLLFVFGEICGILLFWKYLIDYKERLKYSRLTKIPMDYSFELVHMVIMSAGELPIMMVLQYFYVEAMTNFSVIAEGFFSNPLVAINNIVMCFCSLTFLQCCVNMVIDNVFPPNDSLAKHNAFLIKKSFLKYFKEILKKFCHYLAVAECMHSQI